MMLIEHAENSVHWERHHKKGWSVGVGGKGVTGRGNSLSKGFEAGRRLA